MTEVTWLPNTRGAEALGYRYKANLRELRPLVPYEDEVNEPFCAQCSFRLSALATRCRCRLVPAGWLLAQKRRFVAAAMIFE